MRILFFGTFDEQLHPRVRTLREGLEEHGLSVSTCNVPLGVDTAGRVKSAQSPLRAILLVLRILRCWASLLWRSRGQDPNVVVVGYLGQLDVQLARLRFRRATIVLDQMVAMGDTVRDRSLDPRGRMTRVLTAIDHAAQRASDIILIDTQEHLATVDRSQRAKAVVVSVGAPAAWSAARCANRTSHELDVVFFGLFTPLQGAVVIANAIRSIPDAPLRCTFIGRGQDAQAVRAILRDDPRITWVEWVEADRLPGLVAQHDVCLGIFGETPKARRVVPNKVFQGAAAGCAVVTSDTPPQRSALRGAALFVPPGDPSALAAALARLASDRDELDALKAAAAARADSSFTPEAVVIPLVDALELLRP